jgi:hypothetical protein
MIYVKISGETPVLGTHFDELVTFDDGTSEEYIKEYTRQTAIEFAKRYEFMFDNSLNEPTVQEYSEAHKNYVSGTIDRTKYEIMSQRAFAVALDEMD